MCIKSSAGAGPFSVSGDSDRPAEVPDVDEAPRPGDVRRVIFGGVGPSSLRL